MATPRTNNISPDLFVHRLATRETNTDALTGARVIEARSGQRKNRAGQINKVLTEILPGVLTRKNETAAAIRKLHEEAIALNFSETASEEENKQRVKLQMEIAAKLIPIYQAAIIDYDKAVASMRKLSLFANLSDDATQGLSETLADLGMAEATTPAKLIVELQMLRGETYDDLEMGKAWQTFHAATVASLAVWDCAKASKQKDQTSKPLLQDATGEDMQSPRSEYEERVLEAVSGYDACIDKLTLQSTEEKQMADGRPAKETLKFALYNALFLRRRIAEDEVFTYFQSIADAAGEEIDRLKQVVVDHESQLQLAQKASENADRARRLGIAAVEFADRSLDLYDQALSGNFEFPEEQLHEIEAGAAEFRTALGRTLMNSYDAEKDALNLLFQLSVDRYDKALIERTARALQDVNKTNYFHDSCYCELMGYDPPVDVPDSLVPQVLKAITGQYEDAGRRWHALVKEYETKGKGIEGNDAYVLVIRSFADRMQRMEELVQLDISMAESRRLENPGTAEEAYAWIKTTLEEMAAEADEDSDVDVESDIDYESEDENAKTDAQSLSDTEPEVLDEETTPSAHDLATAKAIATAKNALSDAKKDLDLWKEQSEKHRRFARDAKKEGTSPHTVEYEMENAANNELKLHETKTQLSKKLDSALKRMGPDHPQFDDYSTKAGEFATQATQHEKNHKDFLEEGKSSRIAMAKALPPTHTLFHYLCRENQIDRVTKSVTRKERDATDGNGNPLISARTGAQMKDYLDEYEIELKGGKKLAAHVHYPSINAPREKLDACHLKTWKDRGKKSDVHRGNIDVATVQKLDELVEQSARSSAV
jgi:hypothetical protein